MGAVPRRRSVPASLWAAAARRRCAGRSRSPRAPTAATSFRSSSRDRLFRAAHAAAAACARPGGRPRLAISMLKFAAVAAGRARRQAAGGARLRAELSQPGRHGRGLRQECRSARCAAAARFRLRRGRHRHAAAAGRQSAPAPVPARRRRRRHQPARLQQRGRRRRASAGGAARRARAGRRSSASMSAPTRMPSTASPTTCG